MRDKFPFLQILLCISIILSNVLFSQLAYEDNDEIVNAVTKYIASTTGVSYPNNFPNIYSNLGYYVKKGNMYYNVNNGVVTNVSGSLNYKYLEKYTTPMEVDGLKVYKPLYVIMKENNEEFLYFGAYPQTYIKGAELGGPVNLGNGDIMAHGNKYLQIKANYYRKNNYDPKFKNGEYIDQGEYYCIKYEPIKWRIMSKDETKQQITVLSENVLDAKQFASSINDTYANSKMRSWLNDTFLNRAFDSLEQKLIVTSLVDNTRTNGTNFFNNSSLKIVDTEDKIYLPSYLDMLNAEYGFSQDPNKEDKNRLKAPTDLVRMSNIYFEQKTNSVEYTTRSQSAVLTDAQSSVGRKGSIKSLAKIDYMLGVAPMLTMSLDSGIVEAESIAKKYLLNNFVPNFDLLGMVINQNENYYKFTQDLKIEKITEAQQIEDLGVMYKKDKNIYLPKDCIQLQTDEGNFAYFGSYPQTLKKESVTITKDLGDNIYFADDYCRYVLREENYYKIETIKWRLVFEENGVATLLSDKIIDFQQYNKVNSKEVGGVKIYGNNYYESYIREWLNGEFISQAFSDSQKEMIEVTEIITNKETSGLTTSDFDCTNSQDKIYLLSNQEALALVETFGEKILAKQYTDYVSVNFTEPNNTWWLRSPKDIQKILVEFAYSQKINAEGGFEKGMVILDAGIVPAIKINLNK